MAKKKFRTILIDDSKYAWWVRPGGGYVTFVAQREDVNGQIIEVCFKTDINIFWVEFPYTSHLKLEVIKPKDAEAIIRQALELGWYPLEKGRPLAYSLIDDELVRKIEAHG